MFKESSILFHEYYAEWIELYKVGAVRDVTLAKYRMSYQWLKKISPDLKLSELDRKNYQKIMN